MPVAFPRRLAKQERVVIKAIAQKQRDQGDGFDQLGRRDPAHYGTLTYADLERRIAEYAQPLGLSCNFFQTNHEGNFVEHIHKLDGLADGVLLNPGAWTHYSWAIRDALEIAALPAVEVHLSDPDRREEWRRVSVIRDLCVATVAGQGVALGRLELLGPLLADGRLQVLGNKQRQLPDEQAYWLVTAGGERRDEVRQVADWIRAEALAGEPPG